MFGLFENSNKSSVHIVTELLFLVMFDRDALTNLSHLTKPNLRYMGTEDLILDLELMSSIFQTQIHNLMMARECVIEGQQPVTKPNIAVGDLTLVGDHTSKCFMPKYKVDICVVRIEGNKVALKENSGKLCWYHISDVKKTDMISKLISQLPDIDGFGRKGKLSFDPECVQDLGWTPDDWKYRFNPDHVKDIAGPTQDVSRQRSHPMQLRSASENEIQIGHTARLFNAVEYIRNYDSLSWNNS